MTNKIDQDLAYFKLLKIANEMCEGLQIARNTQDLAPKFKATVETNTQTLIDRFKELKATLPESDGPRYHTDSEGNSLRVYSPDDGSMSFTWMDADRNSIGRRPTLDDAKAALAIPRNEKLRGVLVETAQGPLLLPDVRRVDNNLLMKDDVVYSYEITEPDSKHDYKSSQFKVSISPIFSSGGKNVGGRVTQSLKKFLEYEEMYPPAIINGDLLINRATGEEAVVVEVNGDALTIGEKSFTMTVTGSEIFGNYRVPRIEGELTALRNTYEADWFSNPYEADLATSNDAKPSLATRGNDTPAP